MHKFAAPFGRRLRQALDGRDQAAELDIPANGGDGRATAVPKKSNKEKYCESWRKT